ncbi:MAG: hypothetical protein WAN93_03620, partial [Solirubrobacteraceae bacterium]
LSGGGCGGSATVTESNESAPATTQTTTPRKASRKVQAAAGAVRLNNPAQPADPNTHVSCGEAAIGHACQASTASPSDPNQSAQRNCDTNIVANAATSCGLAENAFYEYYESTQKSGQALMVHSPTTNKDYELFCEREGHLIGCTGSPLSTGIYVSFPTDAISLYTSAEADAFASKRDVGHPGPPTTPRTEEQTPEPKSAPESQDSGATDEVGSYTHEGDQSFCEENECIGNFESETGYVVECEDGSYSHAGGISGACSDHGGER